MSVTERTYPPTPPKQHSINRLAREKNLKKVKIAVIEIYESEKSYVASLSQLCDYYSVPLSKQSNTLHSNILTNDQHAGIFSNVYQIYLLNSQLLEAMAPLAGLHVDMSSSSSSSSSSASSSASASATTPAFISTVKKDPAAAASHSASNHHNRPHQHRRQQSITNPLETVYDIFHSFTPFLKMYVFCFVFVLLFFFLLFILGGLKYHLICKTGLQLWTILVCFFCFV